MAEIEGPSFIYLFLFSEEEVIDSGSASEFSFEVAKKFWKKEDAKIDFRAQVSNFGFNYKFTTNHERVQEILRGKGSKTIENNIII